MGRERERVFAGKRESGKDGEALGKKVEGGRAEADAVKIGFLNRWMEEKS